MASYTRDQVQNRLPIKEMMDRFNRERGLKSRFFTAVPLADASNLAYQFTRLATNRQETLPTGNATLDGISDTWQTFMRTNTLPGEAEKKAGNGNGNGATANTQTPPAAQVMPVTPNIPASVSAAYDKVRKDEVAPPKTVNDAYNLLWDNLDPTVRSGRYSGVISDTLANLAKNDLTTFNGVITLLPDEIKEAVMDILEAKALETVNASLKRTVDEVFHISKAPGDRMGYAKEYFDAWNGQVQKTLDWIGKDESLDWEPSDEQKTEAYKTTAVAALRALHRGLSAEVKASAPPPAEGPKPILFETIVSRLASNPDLLSQVAGRWGAMTPEEQAAFVDGLDKETKADEAETSETEEKPKEETSTPPARGGRSRT